MAKNENAPAGIVKSPQVWTDTVANAGFEGFITGLLRYTGCYTNPDELTIPQYRRLLETDETCASCFQFVKNLIINNLGEYQHKDPKKQEFIQQQFDRIIGDFRRDVVGQLLTALWAGYAVGELCIEYAGGKWQLYDIQFLNPEYVEFKINSDGKYKNRIKSVIQKNAPLGIAAGIESEIPLDKLIIYTFQGDFMNPYGKSLCKPIYNDIYFKTNLMPAWAAGLRKNGNPINTVEIQGMYDAVIDPITGAEITKAELMLRIMNSAQGNDTLIVEQGSNIKQLFAGQNIGTLFINTVEYINKMILRGWGIPPMVFDQGKTGAYAQSKTHENSLGIMVETRTQEIEDVILDQIVYPFLYWNFGETKDFGSFTRKKFDPETAKIQAEIYAGSSTAGFISPDNLDDLNKVREDLGFPVISEAEFKKQKEEKAASMPVKPPEPAPAGNSDQPAEETPVDIQEAEEAAAASLESIKRRRAILEAAGRIIHGS